MSAHISSNQNNSRKNTKKKNKLAVFYFSNLDGEGYDLTLLNCILMGIGAVLFLTSGFLGVPEIVVIILRAISVLLAGVMIIQNVIKNVTQGRYLSPAAFAFVSSVCSFCVKNYAASLLIMVLYEIFCIIKDYLTRGEEKRAYAVLRILPNFAYVIENGEKVKRKSSHIKEGDRIFVEKGAVVPVDGYIEEGTVSVDVSPLTRYPENITVSEKNTVMSGCINNSDSFIMCATTDSRHSTAQKIYNSFLKCISDPLAERDTAVKWIEIIVPVLVALFVVFSFIIPIFSHNWAEGIKRGVIFLLCAIPFGVIDITDLAVFNGIEKIFSSGAVIKGSNAMHSLAKISTFVCNKTCTLTENNYKVVDICPHEISEEDMLAVINSVEKQSVHPIARAIRAYSGVEEKLPEKPDPSLVEIPGRGVAAVLGENSVYFGNASLLFEHGVNSEVPDKQGSVVHLAVNGNYCGYVVLENRVRQGSYDAIEKLKACGVKNCVLLSNDLRSVVRPIAGSLNFNVVNSEMTPETKISATEYLLSNKVKNSTMAFAGNGYDEIEAASKADISISLGALGVENTISDFDVAVMGGGLSAVPEMVSAAEKSIRAVYSDLLIFVLVRVIFTILAILKICPVIICVLSLFAFSTVSVLLSSIFFKYLK